MNEELVISINTINSYFLDLAIKGFHRVLTCECCKFKWWSGVVVKNWHMIKWMSSMWKRLSLHQDGVVLFFVILTKGWIFLMVNMTSFKAAVPKLYSLAARWRGRGELTCACMLVPACHSCKSSSAHMRALASCSAAQFRTGCVPVAGCGPGVGDPGFKDIKPNFVFFWCSSILIIHRLGYKASLSPASILEITI